MRHDRLRDVMSKLEESKASGLSNLVAKKARRPFQETIVNGPVHENLNFAMFVMPITKTRIIIDYIYI